MARCDCNLLNATQLKLTFILFSQPLAVLRSTGPLFAYVEILFKWSESSRMDIPFLTFYMWTGIWLAFFLILYSVTEASVLIKYCGRFTEEILAFMVSIVFVASAFEELDTEVQDYYRMTYVALFMGTFVVSNIVNSFRTSRYITHILRELIADLAPAISIVLVSGLSYIVPSKSNDIERAPLPESSDYFATSSGRPWLILDVASTDWKSILICCIPGFLVSLLFVMESNIGMLLTCRAEMRLRPGKDFAKTNPSAH